MVSLVTPLRHRRWITGQSASRRVASSARHVRLAGELRHRLHLNLPLRARRDAFGVHGRLLLLPFRALVGAAFCRSSAVNARAA